jgi:hypothetical protein
MRRLFMVWAVAALMAVMLALMAAPAMADDLFDDGIIILGDNDNDNCDFNNNLFGFFGNNDCDFNDIFGNGFNDNFGIDNGRLRSDIDQESESGDVSLGFRVSNSGDFASQCTPVSQFGNTGNFQNGSSFVQFGSGSDNGFFHRGGIDDFEPEGIDVSFGGSQNVSCPSTIQQSSAASS